MSQDGAHLHEKTKTISAPVSQCESLHDMKIKVSTVIFRFIPESGPNRGQIQLLIENAFISCMHSEQNGARLLHRSDTQSSYIIVIYLRLLLMFK